MNAKQAPDMPLPELRAELQLLPGAPDAEGRPTWLIQDPIANRFIHIDAAAHEALRHWQGSKTILELVRKANASRETLLDEPAIRALIDFLHANQLTAEPKSQGWRHFADKKKSQRKSLAELLIHNYLFFRIPLVKPQAFLERTLPTARHLWSPAARMVIAAMGLIGLYLASRQWEAFLHTFPSYFTWEGIALGGLALILVKTAHELGHAYTAASFGCRVHTMGIAFVVMTPMPYTDVTDSWRLQDRRQRLLIDAAGMMVELAIAAVALFFWAFLPDGTLRSMAFVISAVSAVSSLAVNLNPLMRFDGYYLLSEILGVENLQARAFAIGRWQLREWLFGLGQPSPEDFPPRRILMLTLYAWVVWIYRIGLFVGIALVVYHYFFKALGIILFAVEIGFFVALPIAGELAVWIKMRKLILQSRRAKLTLGAAAAAIAVLIVPWSSQVEIEAVVEAEQLQAIYPVRNARVVTVHVKDGDTVKAGDPIVSLTSDDILNDLQQARISLQIALVQHGRRMADSIDREGSLVLESMIEALRGRIAGLEKELEELEIKAPFAGTIVDMNAELHPRRWVSPRDQIAILAAPGKMVALGYVAEADVSRISEGASAIFVPEHPMRHRIPLKVERVATAGATQIEIADLASTYGGRLAVNADDRRRLLPATAQYLVRLSATAPVQENDLSIRGVVLADGQPESVAARIWRRAVSILVRESGA